jgi:hypothetical protein
MTEDVPADAVRAAVARENARVLLAERFGRFYAPLAVASAVIPALRMFEDTANADGMTAHWGSLLDMAGRSGGDPARIAMLLVGVLIALLITASFRVRSAGLPISIAALAAVLVIMLILKPGTGDLHPALADGGRAALILAVFTLALAVVHAARLRMISARG